MYFRCKKHYSGWVLAWIFLNSGSNLFRSRTIRMLFSFQFSWIFKGKLACCHQTFRAPAEIRTRACLTTSRRATSWATPHPVSHGATPWIFDGGGAGGNILWLKTVIKKSAKHCTVFFLRIFYTYSQRKTYEVPTRYSVDTGEDS